MSPSKAFAANDLAILVIPRALPLRYASASSGCRLKAERRVSGVQPTRAILGTRVATGGQDGQAT